VIRVNLLPQKQKKDRSGGGGESSSQKWLLVVLGVLVLEIVGLVIFHQSKLSELDDQKAKNSQIQAETQKIRELVKNHAEVKLADQLQRAAAYGARRRFRSRLGRCVRACHALRHLELLLRHQRAARSKGKVAG